jgi:TonB family protein
VNVITPDYPDVARQMALEPKTVVISVSLDSRGITTGARIVESSGVASLDAAALAAARASTYTPAMQACKAVPGTYLFQASFLRP